MVCMSQMGYMALVDWKHFIIYSFREKQSY